MRIYLSVRNNKLSIEDFKQKKTGDKITGMLNYEEV